MSLRWIVLLLTSLALAAPVLATAVPESHPGELKFAADLARDQGVAATDIIAVLDKAKYQQSIIDAMTRPAEAKPWKDYRPIFVTERRIADGVAFYRANEALLKRIEAEFGVPAPVIVTILGVETNYGRLTGKYRVLDALVTLAFYYPQRAPFFQGELRQLLLLKSNKFPYAADELVGSYAGAMGWGQFMPTSIAQFARDYDGDGKIDLWNSVPDICASVANYFVVHGWQKDGAVSVRAMLAAEPRTITPANLEPVYPLEQLAQWGYSSPVQLDGQTPATLLTLEGEQGPEFWITLQNFYVISRYNKSPLYSMAVFQLSEALAARLAQPQPP
jgi:membrane-bound lytic murein transglycosylase B